MDILKILETLIESQEDLSSEIDYYDSFTLEELKSMTDKGLADLLFNDFEINHVVLEELEEERKDIIEKNIEKKVMKLTAKKKLSILNTDLDKIIEDYYKDEKYNIIKEVLNEKVKEFNVEVREHKDQCNKNINRLKKIVKMLKDDYKSIDLDKIKNWFNETDLDHEVIKSLIPSITDYIEEKRKIHFKELEKTKIEKEEIEKKKKEEQLQKSLEEEERKKKEEEKLKNTLKYKIKSIGEINETFEKYENLLLFDIETLSYDDTYDLDMINEEVLSLPIGDIDFSIFDMSLFSLLSMIKNNPSEEEIKKINTSLEKLFKKYEAYLILSEIQESIENLWKYFILDETESSLLANYQNELLPIKEKVEVDNILENELISLKEKIYKIRRDNLTKSIQNAEKVSIKGFILFDYQRDKYKNKKPYILSDLDVSSKDTQIDSSIDKSRIASSGYNDFNNLIYDILLYGKPSSLLNNNDKINKIIRPVYHIDNDFKEIDTKMKNATGMYRIRPVINTYVRFIEEKYDFTPNTNKYNQIKDLIESKLKNTTIGDNEPFSIYINYLTAFKLSDTSSYKLSEARQKNSEIRELFLSKNDSFTNEEISLISETIDNSIITYDNLEKINENFDFNILDNLTNSNSLK